jgi:uncharacterized protein (DUF342 family)
MSVEQDLLVCIPDDRQHAFLVLSGALAPAMVTEETVAGEARRAGVAFDKGVVERIRAAVAAYRAAPGPARVEIAVARPPTQPVDGGLEWEPGRDPNEPEKVQAEGAVDHYAVKRLVRVNVGDVVARVRAPKPGEDGRDVTGRVLAARAARASELKVGAGMSVDPSGRVVADAAGIVELEGSLVRVSDQLHVLGDVDFASGNVDFAGAVSVAGGVKPCFKVKAARDVQISGLVEDATLTCGGTLDCRRGLTAKTRGEVQVGGDLHAVFLNTIHGVVGRHLMVHREVMNCQLEVRGNVRSPRTAILGGKLSVAGCAEINELGSPNWKETDLVLGWSVRAGIDTRIAELRHAIGPKRAAYEQVKALGKRATPAQRESLTELEFELWELEQELAKRHAELERHLKLAQEPLEQSNRWVLVHRAIHPKARIHLANEVVTFSVDVRGPVRISLDPRDHLVASIGDSTPVLLTDLAHGVGARKAA